MVLAAESSQSALCTTLLFQVDPDYAYAYTLLAHEYVFIEELDKALACFRNGLRVDSRHYNAWWVVSHGLYYSFAVCLSLSLSVCASPHLHTHISLSFSPASHLGLCCPLPFCLFTFPIPFFKMPLCPGSLFTLFSASKDDGCLISLTIYPLC